MMSVSGPLASTDLCDKFDKMIDRMVNLDDDELDLALTELTGELITGDRRDLAITVAHVASDFQDNHSRQRVRSSLIAITEVLDIE